MALLKTICRVRLKGIWSTKFQSRRGYHDHIRFATSGATVRLPLSSTIGVVNSRGSRSHQEDFYAFSALSLDPGKSYTIAVAKLRPGAPEELYLSVKKYHGVDWDPTAVGDTFNRQAVFVGIYDGHGGSAVSQYLRQELHGLLESVDTVMIPELFLWVKEELGGYFKRFSGGLLQPWIHDQSIQKFDLGARATAAFFEVDKTLSSDEVAQTCGATASIAILHSLDSPASPFFSSKKLALTVAHCGDTRVLLCSTKDGTAFAMTENHHHDSRVESARLRRMMGSSLITDSYGESRWMGALANTRCLGDLRYKRFGVTPEPEIRTKLLEGDEWACLICVSDGISSLVSDNEIVGLSRHAPDPKTAAQRILAFAEELGAEDNATALVVPLAGWGKIRGPDATKELREYRLLQAEGTERQRRM